MWAFKPGEEPLQTELYQHGAKELAKVNPNGVGQSEIDMTQTDAEKQKENAKGSEGMMVGEPVNENYVGQDGQNPVIGQPINNYQNQNVQGNF